MKTQSKAMAQREQERHYGISLMQMLTPFFLLGAAFLVAVILTVR